MTTAYAYDVLIVGAGLSGLMAAGQLNEAGHSVRLLDKGRSVGGRLATRRVGAGLADHGAQFFTVRMPEFGAFVDRWLGEGWVYEWARGWSDAAGVTTNDGHPRYAARGGLNQIAKQLAEGLDIGVDVLVKAVRPLGAGWQIEIENGESLMARALLLTPPVPQSLALLKNGSTPLEVTDRQMLEAIAYEPCLVALVQIDRPVMLPEPGAIQREGAPIQWIADNRRKGISPNETIVTMQASGAFSRDHYDAPETDVLAIFREDLLPLIGDARIGEMQLKKWRYSRPTVLHPERTLVARNLPPLVFAGDAFGGWRVEGAAVSGLAAAGALVGRL